MHLLNYQKRERSLIRMADVFNDRVGMSGKGRIRICATVSILGLIDLIALFGFLLVVPYYTLNG